MPVCIGFVGIQKRGAKPQLPATREQQHPRHYQHIAQYGGHLRAHQMRDFIHKGIDRLARTSSLSL